MSVAEFGFLVLAGIGAGLTGSIAGLASLISYPGAAGHRPAPGHRERHQHRRAGAQQRRLGERLPARTARPGTPARSRSPSPPSWAGRPAPRCCCSRPPGAFERIVPLLIAGGLGGDPGPAAAPRAGRRGLAAPPGPRDPRWLAPGTFAIGIYGGYFGAAAGRAACWRCSCSAPARGSPAGNAMKNVVLGVANAVAAVGYVFFSSVAWSAALPLAIGLPHRRPARAAGGAPVAPGGAAPGHRHRGPRPGRLPGRPGLRLTSNAPYRAPGATRAARVSG